MTTDPTPPEDAPASDETPGSNGVSQAGDPFDTGAPERRDPETDADSLIVDVDGFEGPLDVLLTLAKTQKVDLAKISILALAEQYLGFIHAAKKLRLELAADYLVMAAWLTYLKSKLLLPEPETEDDTPSGEELAARLQFQLQRLEAMREAAAKLMARDRLGRDVFARGAPEPVRVVLLAEYRDTLHDLLKAYTRQRTRNIEVKYEPTRPPIYAIEEARARIESMLGRIGDWSSLDSFLPDLDPDLARDPVKRRTHLASTFTAALELVRDGLMEVRQLKQFGPVYVRKRGNDSDAAPAPGGGELVAFPGGGPAGQSATE